MCCTQHSLTVGLLHHLSALLCRQHFGQGISAKGQRCVRLAGIYLSLWQVDTMCGHALCLGCMRVCVFVSICVSVCLCICVCICLCFCICMCVSDSACAHARMRVHTGGDGCMGVCVCVCVCVRKGAGAGACLCLFFFVCLNDVFVYVCMSYVCVCLHDLCVCLYDMCVCKPGVCARAILTHIPRWVYFWKAAFCLCRMAGWLGLVLLKSWGKGLQFIKSKSPIHKNSEATLPFSCCPVTLPFDKFTLAWVLGIRPMTSSAPSGWAYCVRWELQSPHPIQKLRRQRSAS